MSLETLKPKVAKLIKKAQNGGGGGEFVGIKFLDIDSYYSQPLKVDLRSIPQPSVNLSFFGSYMFTNLNANGNGGLYVRLQEVFLPDWIVCFAICMFKHCANLENIYGDFSRVFTVSNEAFSNCKKLLNIPYMPNLQTIGSSSFSNCTGLTEVIFPATITSINSNSFNGCTNVTDVYCPWAEGAVANAPWGMTNATIHYNYNSEV